MRPQFPSHGHASAPREPRAQQRPFVQTVQGVSLSDEFAWLKAANWQEVMRDPEKLDPAIRAYLQAENDYCERALGDTAALQTTLSCPSRTACVRVSTTAREAGAWSS